MKADSIRWRQLWRDAKAKTDVTGRYAQLVELYSQPQRHYHNLRHIDECLGEFDRACPVVHDPMAVELAIWFHDAIYDSHGQDNEERSAQLAQCWISEAGCDQALSESVSSLVLATKNHDPALHADAALLVDVDLSILGQSIDRFEEYERQIRSEYHWVPQTLFAAKRAEILERFLARARIYTTQHFFDKYERDARRNLEQSVRRLRDG